jgi:hypothetical protein
VDDRKDTTEDTEILKNKNNNKSARLVALILIIYQVRCNLFHGNKLFSSESDQIVVRTAANVLQQILSHWIR